MVRNKDLDSCRVTAGLTEEDLRKLSAGTFYNSYEKLGAHLTVEGDVSGVRFAVWAPEADSVRVAGDFNQWNGDRHPMRKLGLSGVYELFVPDLKEGEKYKFEVITSDGSRLLKADPYAFQAELRPATASVVCRLGEYSWSDEAWMSGREAKQAKDQPFSIYEVHLGSWKQKAVAQKDDGTDINGSQFYSYGELGEWLVSYVKKMGYTHVELMPVMEHPLDASWGYQITGFYAPTSRFGTPDDFRGMINLLHNNGIGVILDWVPTQFPKDAHGLASFDGTCLYEHKDPRQGENPGWGTLIFNYGRPQVSNYLISNALYWAKEFHVDGIRVNGVESVLYLDYRRNAGEWIANIYGGNENFEAVEFFKHLNSVFHKEVKGAVTIAEEATEWPRVTGKLDEEGLGFDYKWNHGWTEDFLRYIKQGKETRQQNYGDLTFSMLYAYSEDFMQVFSHDDVVHGKGTMIEKMPGDDLQQKMANLRTAYGFLMGHPGKKLLFMGQEFGEIQEWNEARSLAWELCDQHPHAKLQEYGKALNALYTSQPALYEMDYVPEGFQWINCTYAEENIVTFIRAGKKQEDTLLFVCNFGWNAHETFRVGVPFEGIWEEILNSDRIAFGGDGWTNPQSIPSEKVNHDNRSDSISIRLAPLSVAVFRRACPASVVEMQEEKIAKTKQEPVRKERVKMPELPIHPVKTAKAASEAIAHKGADALDKLSETVGKIRKKNPK